MSLVTKKSILNWCLLFVVAAMGVHLYLTVHYYEIKLGGAEGKSLCNVGEKFNCDTVAASSYAQVLDVPLALWGFVTHLILLGLLVLAKYNISETPKRLNQYLFGFSAVVALASVVMGSISFFALDTYCLFCIFTYILSFLTLAGVWFWTGGLQKNVGADLKALFTTHKEYLGLFVSVPVIAFIANSMFMDSYGLKDLERFKTEKVAYWSVSPQQNFDLSQGLRYQASDKPVKMTIVEFADFRCGHCKTAAPSLHAFAKSNPDVELIYKPFPLDGVCNSAITGGDGGSCKLAYAAFCAEKIEKKGWAVHDGIFAVQSDINRGANIDKELEKISQSNGINWENLKTCIDQDAEIKDAVRKMAQEGATAQIQGTPAVFVNGKLLTNGQMIPILQAVYSSLK